MLKDKQIEEIRNKLNESQNPLFFFDNDNDGLLSFIILRRYIDRGRGVAIRSFPDLSEQYFRKINELNPDSVFILDKPIVNDNFINRVREKQLPLIWIDHHNVDKPKDSYIKYYNPIYVDGKSEPISYLAYKITNKREDMWLSVIGCISDCYLPDFYLEFAKENPELVKLNPKGPFDVLYNTELGKIARILDFGLKDTTTNVVKMLKFLMKVKGPRDILEENNETNQLHKRFNEINSRYQLLIEKARTQVKNNLVYFQYGGVISLSSNISNQLIYEHPNKVIVVVYINSDIANISIRGKINVLKLTENAISEIDGATGGGHEHATGAKMSVSDLPLFKERIEKYCSELKLDN